MDRKAFTIVRATWGRGNSVFDSLLLDAKTGLMCCLGQIALQCGAVADQIAGITTPGKLFTRGITLDAFFEGLLTTRESGLSYSNGGQHRVHSVVALTMMHVNDDISISDTTREAELTRLAATIGWDLTFID